jgi:hypothetical protein
MTDQLKIITSTLEFDPRSLEQPELEVDVVETAPVVRGGRAARSTLDRLLSRVSTRNALSTETPRAVADWRTDDLYVVTKRPPTA